jgi:hypothetical protein
MSGGVGGADEGDPWLLVADVGWKGAVGVTGSSTLSAEEPLVVTSDIIRRRVERPLVSSFFGVFSAHGFMNCASLSRIAGEGLRVVEASRE